MDSEEFRKQIDENLRREAERREKYEAESLRIQREMLETTRHIQTNLEYLKEKGLAGLNDYLEIVVKDENSDKSAGTQDDVKKAYSDEN